MTALLVVDEPENPLRRAPLVEGKNDFASVTNIIAGVAEKKTPRGWYLLFGCSIALLLNLGAMIGYLVFNGIGVWGNNIPVGWGWPIVNFVFWIGIGHAGTLISAILFLFRQKWRTSINRASEAMTIFAVMAAGIFPAIHVGRIWVIYWVFPLPNQMSLWPNFKSPLLWDVFAVSTYFTISALFWFVGLIPDLATFRDRAMKAGRTVAAKAYGVFAFGWHGSNRHWLHYEKAYLILAALSTPLVLSVHSIVSFDFAVSLLPGWHTTIFPPYFVAGAIFSGFGMVITLMVPARQWLGLHELITLNHLDNIAKILLLTGTMVGYAYGMEFFIAWYSGVDYEQFAFINRATGPYWWAYWIMVTCNVDQSPVLLVPQHPPQPAGPLRHLDLRQHRDVVRALRDHGHVAEPRLPALELGLLLADAHRRPDLRRQLRPVLHVVPAVLPVPADPRDQRGEGRDAGGQPAPRPRLTTATATHH
jgi:Ni/Fe-hydrogenase subunit HybB-like protein